MEGDGGDLDGFEEWREIAKDESSREFKKNLDSCLVNIIFIFFTTNYIFFE